MIKGRRVTKRRNEEWEHFKRRKHIIVCRSVIEEILTPEIYTVTDTTVSVRKSWNFEYTRSWRIITIQGTIVEWTWQIVLVKEFLSDIASWCAIKFVTYGFSGKTTDSNQGDAGLLLSAGYTAPSPPVLEGIGVPGSHPTKVILTVGLLQESFAAHKHSVLL